MRRSQRGHPQRRFLPSAAHFSSAAARFSSAAADLERIVDAVATSRPALLQPVLPHYCAAAAAAECSCGCDAEATSEHPTAAEAAVLKLSGRRDAENS